MFKPVNHFAKSVAFVQKVWTLIKYFIHLGEKKPKIPWKVSVGKLGEKKKIEIVSHVSGIGELKVDLSQFVWKSVCSQSSLRNFYFRSILIGFGIKVHTTKQHKIIQAKTLVKNGLRLLGLRTKLNPFLGIWNTSLKEWIQVKS
jgi:hypothetical protein